MTLSSSDITAIRKIIQEELELFFFNISEIRFKSPKAELKKEMSAKANETVLEKVKDIIIKDDGGQGC